ncbi:MAG: hypothetical protein FJ386_12185 [Verrucomicrobia bacterium]|nr:hypothetical protein [Verrucomicrobiota bacterium]
MADTNTAVIRPAPANAVATTNAAEDIRGIRPPVNVPGEWAWLGWTLAALAALALLVQALRKLVPRLLHAPPLPVVPPHVRARAKLADALALLGDPRLFCIAVSEVTRVYLEERFDFRAPERTTEEFLAELRATDRLTDGQKLSLGDFLSRCDLVKFARYEPARPELEDLHAAALRLVDETAPQSAPEPRQPQPATP